MPPPYRLEPFTAVLALGAALRAALIVYSIYHDARSPLKYTDVDYSVFSDAARCLLDPAGSGGGDGGLGAPAVAAGPLARWAGWNLGSPYGRETYRYTPLLAALLLPNHLLHPAWGKAVFAAGDLAVGWLQHRLLLRSRGAAGARAAGAAWMIVAGVWLANPLVVQISTRGSAESLLGALVVAGLAAAAAGRWDASAAALGLAAHWKLYPVVYGASVWAALAPPKSRWWSVGGGQVRYGVVALATLALTSAAMYAIWGQPFLEHSYLYHLHRLDHRHNFSPYFYGIYLTFRDLAPPPPAEGVGWWRAAARHPLASFAPQVGLSLGLGAAFGGEDLPFAWFVQTIAFASFNKVATSQYFMWYLWLLPMVLPNLRLTPLRGAMLLIAWVGGQGLWLSQAFRLEMLGQPVFREVWMASIVFLVATAWVLGELIAAYEPSGARARARGSRKASAL